ncbi:MAG TPA: DUF4440 domain-containing protein [Pyrinomonadaceae bacterium]|nr:DUF4440 domain-containing protein [Pyrinomonadaceae bacterium]
MKRCRTCNRTYTDPSLSYCIDDGTPLITDAADDESTVVNTSSANGRSTDDDWNAVAYRPPSAYIPPGAMPRVKQRRAWPWVVGIMGAFVLGAVALMIAAAIFVPRMVRSRQASPPAPANQPVIVSNEPDRTENVDAPPPTDEAQVLEQLRELENDWTIANFKADKKKLDRILADDYVGQAAGGGLEGKKQYIDEIQPNDQIDRWNMTDLKVDLSGNRATLTGVVTFFARGQQQSFNFTDKFVWRNGRWQATGSEVQKRE